MEYASFSNILNACLIVGVSLIVILAAARKLIGNHGVKSIEIAAAVIDKRESSYTKYTPVPQQATDYVLVFKSGEKSLSFFTSIWIYDSVKKGDYGTLKYKGSHLIGFEQK